MNDIEIQTFVSFDAGGGSVTMYAICCGRQIISWHETQSEAEVILARLEEE